MLDSNPGQLPQQSGVLYIRTPLKLEILLSIGSYGYTAYDVTYTWAKVRGELHKHPRPKKRSQSEISAKK